MIVCFSYASRKSPTYRDYCDLARSRSKSASPVNSGKITYITSFSGEEVPSGSSPKPAKPPPRKRYTMRFLYCVEPFCEFTRV